MAERSPQPTPESNAALTTLPGERVTIVRSIKPDIAAKRFFFCDGKLVKESVANVTTGQAWSKPANDAESFAATLQACAGRSDCCLISGLLIGDNIDGKPFALVTEEALARVLKTQPGDPAPAGLHDFGRKCWAARLKRSMTPGEWILLDADDAPGMPEEMRRLNVRQQFDVVERVLPGIAKAERISRSSNLNCSESKHPTSASILPALGPVAALSRS